MLEEDKKKTEEEDSSDNEDSDSGGSSGGSSGGGSGTGNKSDTEDGNYIKKDGENKSETKEEDHKKTIYEELKEELHKVAGKLEDAIVSIRPKRKQERELDKETGGTEVDYEKEKKLADEDKDIWDEKPKETPGSAMDGDSFETTANQSFIHSKKRGKGKKKGKLGPMTLNDKNTQNDDKPTKGKDGKETKMVDAYGREIKKETMVEKLQRFKIDRSHEDGGMMR